MPSIVHVELYAEFVYSRVPRNESGPNPNIKIPPNDAIVMTKLNRQKNLPPIK